MSLHKTYKNTKISTERVSLLDSIGFAWDGILGQGNIAIGATSQNTPANVAVAGASVDSVAAAECLEIIAVPKAL